MRKLALAVALLVAGRAAAIEYEVPIDIDNEDDLYELRATEQISDDTLDVLLDLFHRGVDLNEADAEEVYALPGLTLKDAQAIVSYRKAAGQIDDARALVNAGVLSEEKLRRIVPFLQTRATGGPALAATGRVQAEATYTSRDGRLPATAISAKLSTLRYLTVGAAFLVERNLVGDVRWDPNRQALSAEEPGLTPDLAKIYLDWRTPTYEIIAGSFKAGFGLQLVYDSTSLSRPNGIYADQVIYRKFDLVRGCYESAGELSVSPCPDPPTYVTPDYVSRPALFGLGVALRELTTDVGWLQLVGFVSRQVHSIYQYEIFDRSICADPTQDKDPRCAAPEVFRRAGDPLAPTSRFDFKTLPSMWAEPLAGGNATFFFNRRTHIGVTGYGAKPEWLTKGVDLDFQEWSRWPYGGAYGAIGGDAAWGADLYDVGVEVARSFDGQPGAGGYGAIARGTVSWPRYELELSLRYYDQDFANPYSGALAEPDQVDGQRARDEAGARLRFGGKLTPHVELRGFVDFWTQPSNGTPKSRVEVRGDYLFSSATRAGVYTRWEDKDLRSGGYGQCYFTTTTTLGTDELGQPLPCTGQKLDVGALVTVEPLARFLVTLNYMHRFVDDPNHMTDFQQQSWAWLVLSWFPTKELHLYARSRLAIYDLSDSAHAERSVWSYLEASYRVRELAFIVRYDNRYFFDDRSSTAARDPNPEHWLRVEVESRF